MSIIPSFFSVKPNVYDPFGLDLWGYPLGDAIPNGRSLHASSYTDWKETPEAHVFRIDLPGFNKNEVKVEVAHEKVLQISGERKKEVEEKNDKWHCVERSHGKFVRRFRLPDNTKVDQVKAGLENGVLTVTVPKDLK